MSHPLFWLGISLLLVAISLTAVLAIAIPVMQELARTARTAEKLLDTLRQELPPTLQALRSTGDDLSTLSDQVNEGVRSASQVVKQVDEGIGTMRHQAGVARTTGLSVFAGLRAAWQTLAQPQGYWVEAPASEDTELNRRASSEEGYPPANAHGVDASASSPVLKPRLQQELQHELQTEEQDLPR